MREEEGNEISIQEARTFQVLRESKEWLTNKELHAKTEGVAERSVRLYTLKFVKLGIADLAEVWPAHRYRFSGKAGKRNVAYLQRLENAILIFRLS